MTQQNIGEFLIPVRIDMTGLDSQLATVKGKFQNVGRSMTDIGKKMTLGISVPMLGLGGLAVKAASDFESSFAGVRKTVDATEAQFGELSDALRKMSLEIPVNVNELNAIAEAAGALGIKREDILGFTKVVAELAVTTDLTSDAAANALARIGNVMGSTNDDFDRMGNTLVALGNAGASTESEIVAMAQRLAGAGATVGLTEPQVLSFASALASVGINAEAGGSAFSRVMVQMADVTAGGAAQQAGLAEKMGISAEGFFELARAAKAGGEAGAAAAEQLQALAAANGLTVSEMGKMAQAAFEADTKLNNFARVAGMSAETFVKAFQEDPAAAIIAFTTGLERIQGEGENVFQTLENLELGEIRVRDALLRAANAGELFTEQMIAGETAWEENNARTKEAAERFKTFDSQMKLAKAEAQDIAITLGTALLPIILDILKELKPFIARIKDLAERFSNLDPRAQKIILAVVALVVAIGPLLIVLGMMASGIGAIIAIAPVLGAAFTLMLGPVGLIILALAGLVAAGVLVWRNWDEIRVRASQIWNAITGIIQGAWSGIANIVRNGINSVTAFINNFINSVNRIRINIPRIPLPFGGSVGGGSIGMPHIPTIPMMDTGGLVKGPGVFGVGAGVKEIVRAPGHGDVLEVRFRGGNAGAEAIFEQLVESVRVRTGSRI